MVTALFASAAIIFAALYWLLRRSTKRATDQMRHILSDSVTNRHTYLYSPDKRLEALLVEVNRLLTARQTDRILHERKEREFRRQIANITHDLRTPLTSMLGYIELLQEEHLTVEEAKEYLIVVEKRAKALRSLICSFYDLSRIEAGDYPIMLQKIDLQALLKRALADHYSEIIDSGIQVNLDLTDTNCFVIADEESVMRIYMNVLQNVLKHGQRSLLVFQGVREDALVTLISNETISLQEEDVPYLFERSFTGDRARTEHNSGLGLAVVKGLMEQMGGRVHVEYHASLFTLCLEWRK
ncbi:two-component sensor histidine kinase [Paenibacillus sp. J23TS9]|uniref:sensor histidine kinase n=1 Tax=Paenibacillus sp. J23TS9 TaxID=2807193 RepID=UPI001B06388C|nr:HAMP domain-containing sensor histidine kinase [Paenibacillus sp. J23TS9]GIP26549.1 two-component sensor histidine kinase [Paenibacillus sp. J23TS9]